MKRNRKDHFPRLTSEIQKRFDEQTKDGSQVGFNVMVHAERGSLRGVDSLVFHTVGMHDKDLPEIVIFLGPRREENPIPEDDAVQMSKNILNALKQIETITMLVQEKPGVFITRGNAPRRFMKVPLNEEAMNVIKYGRLSHLTAYYNDCNYDFILYEPSPWIH